MNNRKIREELKKNPFSLLWELVYNCLYEEIVSGNLKPGDKVREIQIAGELGVSRSPVKKAIDELIEKGFLERSGGKTPTVRGLTYDEYLKLYEARYAVETHAAGLAAKNLSGEEIDKLEYIVEKIGKAAKALDRIEYNKWDALFHETVINGTKNNYMINLYNCIRGDLSRYRFHLVQRCYSEDEERYFLSNVYQVHKDIINAVKSRSAVLAREEMANDIKTMLGTIHRVLF